MALLIASPVYFFWLILNSDDDKDKDGKLKSEKSGELSKNRKNSDDSDANDRSRTVHVKPDTNARG